MTIRVFLLLAILLPYLGLAQSKSYTAKRITANPPVIDGKFSDECWKDAIWEGGFVQHEPYEDSLPSQNTEFSITYDDNNIYVAIKAFDTETDKINKRLTRRDDNDGDWVGIVIDSYEDKLTGFAFDVTAAGSKVDIIYTNDNQEDESWDPIWYVKTSSDAAGWYAEMRIPLSQLRFTRKQSYEWGLEVARYVFRKNELSLWKPIHKSSNKLVSDFGVLYGINNIRPKKDIELFPFALAKTTFSEKEDGNPFATGRSNNFSAGVDGKVSITNDLTLNFSVNPDFGQVEADPSEVNLSAYESFFPEKRPFFIEGRNIFNFTMTSGDGDGSRTGLFYSRRIGRSPHFEPDLDDNEYARYTPNANILGAFKLSGKTRKGTSIGILETFTRREETKIDKNGEQSNYPVEPFTNYFMARVLQDIDKGNTVVGGLFTATNRSINHENFNTLPASAYTGGAHWTRYWDNKNYFVGVKGIFSSLHGTREAITELQSGAAHNFQRPDAKHLSIDSTRTSLAGHGGTLEFGKFGGGHLRALCFVTWSSPGLDYNDMGFMYQADHLQQVAWVGYNEWKPKGFYNSFNFGGDIYTGWNFAGQNLYNGLEGNGFIHFKNHSYTFTGFNLQASSLSANDLRGGPMIKYPASFVSRIGYGSDTRKKLQFEMFVMKRWSSYSHTEMTIMQYSFIYKATNSISVSLSPGYTSSMDKLQYVTTIEDVGDNKYIMAQLNGKQVALSARLNVGITPDMSVQYYGQPFFFSGDYSQYKIVTNPLDKDYYKRYHQFTNSEISYNEDNDAYDVTPASGQSYSFDDPDFHFLQFRSNLVFRWEYKPGSTLFLVWSQGRTTDDGTGKFAFNDYSRELVDKYPQNDFLIKISYALIF